MESKVFICPFCGTLTEIDDVDSYKDGYTQYREYYVECPKCTAKTVIETINKNVKYPVTYYVVDKRGISTTKQYHNPKIDKYI